MWGISCEKSRFYAKKIWIRPWYLLKMKLNNTCLNLVRTTTSVSIITFVDISVRIYHVGFIVASDIINSN